MTSKQPRRLEVRSDLGFEFFGPNCICYHVIWTVLAPFGANGGKKERKKKEDNSPLLELLGFAATKKIRASNG